MNYKKLVDNIKEAAETHLMINDYGYGDISDIKYRSESGATDNVDYPYMFLNPTIHGRTNNTMIYRFNIIMMDLVRKEDYLKIQSDCQEYINDVIERLRSFYKLEINLDLVEYTPFKERFIDDVAGFTALVEITVIDKLDNCISPY